MPDWISKEGGPPPKNLLDMFGKGGVRPHLPALPGPVKMILTVLLILVVVSVVFVGTVVDYVKPYEYGIKQVNIGLKTGILEKVYTPGYWFVKPFGMEKIHHFPRHLQVLDLTFTGKRDSDSPSHTYYRAAKIQTSDGSSVDVDATVLYSIKDPYKVMTTLGTEKKYLTNGIMPKVEPFLKKALGKLNIQDFYNSEKRTGKANEARDALNAELKEKGLEVKEVLIRYFKYNDTVQSTIEAKALQDQLILKNQAEAKANTEEAKTKKAAQEGEMKVKIIIQEGEAYKTKKMAEQDLYTRTKAAEGELLVKTAEAEATQLKNDAMQILGYDRKVAIEMAKALNGLECIVVPTGGANGVNPLDLDGMLKLFGVQLDTTGTSPPPPPPPPPPVAVITPVAPVTEGGAAQ